MFSLTMKTIYVSISLQMETIDHIRTLLIEQKEEFSKQDLGIERTKLTEIKRYKDTTYPIIISGLRRAGKSTLLAQIAHAFYPKGNYFFVNFEDERFINFKVSDFTRLHELFIELFGDKKIFFLDEIQNIQGWERFVSRMIKSGYKFYITGSNASLLSQELGTKLTGRYIPLELLPFSFEEYLEFKKISLPKISQLTTVERGKLKSAFANYLTKGGIPQTLQYPELPIHKTLYDDILYRDIAARYKLTDIKPLKELSFYLMSNISSLISFNKLKELLKLGSVNTVSSYIEYLQTSWLLFVLNKYAFSVKEQQIANKKIYSIDTGLTKSIAFSFSENKGKFLENLVFLNLWKENKDIYYYKTQKNNEIDFYMPQKKLFVQVCQSLTEPATRERELRALAEGLQEIKGSTGFVLTEDDNENYSFDGIAINVLPVYEWLLEKNNFPSLGIRTQLRLP